MVWPVSLQVVRGSTECVKGPFDLVIANLPWEVQMDKVSELDRLAASRGRLILSGFRDNQENLVNRELPEAGMVSEPALNQGLPASRAASGYKLHLGCLVAGRENFLK